HDKPHGWAGFETPDGVSAAYPDRAQSGDQAGMPSDTRYHPHLTAQTTDVTALERTLRRKVRGEVRFDKGSRAVYSTDSSNFRMPPLGVVVPLDIDDVI